MIVTEEEASTKQCQESLPAVTMCVATHCMAWRWKATTLGSAEKKGYCGKAGEAISMPTRPTR